MQRNIGDRHGTINRQFLFPFRIGCRISIDGNPIRLIITLRHYVPDSATTPDRFIIRNVRNGQAIFITLPDPTVCMRVITFNRGNTQTAYRMKIIPVGLVLATIPESAIVSFIAEAGLYTLRIGYQG